MKILMAAPEVAPFAKTGGLAEVVAALSKTLAGLGHDVRIILPRYQVVKPSGFNPVVEKIWVEIGSKREKATVKATLTQNNLVYFVENERYFNREGLYGTPYGDHQDNDERFIFFSKAILAFLKTIDYQPDVIHCHDWQTGLIPVYLTTLYHKDPFYSQCATLFTIHNLAYQGLFPADRFNLTGLSQDEFTTEGLEFYNKISFIKGGLIYSDIINTVSRSYLEEIQTPEYGMGLDGALRSRREVLYGINNGLDYSEWAPAKDSFIFKRYDLNSLKLKKKNKDCLLDELRLTDERGLPLIGMVSRLIWQKGIDLLVSAMDDLMHLPLQIVILGKGERQYHDLLIEMAKRYPQRLSINFGYDNILAHKIYAGSDIFLMPSRYEPCGLAQLISLRYGTIPVVRATGGLKDSILEFDPQNLTGNGFVFSRYCIEEFLGAIKRAISIYKEKVLWRRLMTNAMREDFSWNRRAEEYVKLYKEAISKKLGKNQPN